MRRRTYLIGIGLILITLVLVGVRNQGAVRIAFKNRNFLSSYARIYEAIDTLYVGVSAKAPSEKQLSQGALKGLVRSLNDPYSVYLTPDETKFLNDESAGSFSGIGATLKPEDMASLTVIEVKKGSASQKAGVRIGDRIIAIDNVAVSEYSYLESIMHIRGAYGETVELTILRKDVPKPIVLKVKREEVIMPELHVASRMDGRIGIIVIPEFGLGTAEEFYFAIIKLSSKGAVSYVVDLRGNPGGGVKTCVDIASAWAREKQVVTVMKGKSSEDTYFSENVPSGFYSLLGEKTVLLVNGASASASEILAGALQDWGVATVMGTTTFGKGIAQSVINYRDGSSLHITSARWFTPKGREIHGKGIKPDIEVRAEAGTSSMPEAKKGKDKKPVRDIQMERALEYLATGK